MSHPSHDCHALLVTCMDWRLHPHVEDHFGSVLDGSFDLISVGGGIKALAEDSGSLVSEYILNCVDVSSRLHGIAKVVLVNHDDCGAYGGHAAFETGDSELERHATDLGKAAALIGGRFPGLIVETWLARMIPEGDDWLVEVEAVG